FATVIGAVSCADLNASVGRQDHTTSPSRSPTMQLPLAALHGSASGGTTGNVLTIGSRLRERLPSAVAKDGVIPQYHRAGLKKCEAIEATTHTTKTPIATRPTCLDIRSILACKTSASTEALSVVCSLACSK